jgi:uncharacterized repeat protein (TIGR01451 family)
MRIAAPLWVFSVALCVLLFGLFSRPLGSVRSGLVNSAEAALQPSEQRDCYLLDDPVARRTMSGMLETMLLRECGRADELGGVQAPVGFPFSRPMGLGPDVLVNDPTGDSGISHTQSETSVAINPNTGTICVAYNDSFHAIVQNNGASGFSVSTDGGATFDDQGAFGHSNRGDPSLYWRRLDGKFYYVALLSNGMGIFRSDDDCQSFTLVSNFSTTFDDKEIMVIDNNPGSLYYGRFYVAWKDFTNGGFISLMYSDNGTTWSNRIQMGVANNVQGAWPAVAPNGDVYVAWLHWVAFPDFIDIKMARSTDGGDSLTPITPPLVNGVNPRDAVPTTACARPALNGNIRIASLPQAVVSPNGDLHAVYSYDPDGYNTGDVIDVFYRRSTDNGATWEPEIRLNDDVTDNDNFMVTISAGDDGTLVATWYDRRLDVNNLLFDFYMSVSKDGGQSWEPNVRVSDVSSPVYIDPSMATCYHGDYDQQVQNEGKAFIAWADDRNMQGGHNDPDIWFDVAALGPSPASLTITKTQPVGQLAVGETITYTIAVTNSGGLSATNVVVTDTLNGNAVVVGGPDTIEAGGTAVYTFTYVIQEGDCDSGLSNISAVSSQETGVVTMAEPIMTKLDCMAELYFPVVLKSG